MLSVMIFPHAMTRSIFLYAAPLTAALFAGSPALAQPVGALETLPLGQYRCAVPGSAAGQAWVPVAGMNFVIGNASSYSTSEGSGTYLATGKTVTFTRGPMKGVRFDRRSKTILQKREADGTLGRLRCVREGPAS